MPTELFILATAANQLFQASHRMTSDALVSLLSALAQVSAQKVPVGPSSTTSSTTVSTTVVGTSTSGSPRFAALNRMVETMLANRLRMQASVNNWYVVHFHAVNIHSLGTCKPECCLQLAFGNTTIVFPEPAPQQHDYLLRSPYACLKKSFLCVLQ
jgi:hypothetical protein